MTREQFATWLVGHLYGADGLKTPLTLADEVLAAARSVPQEFDVAKVEAQRHRQQQPTAEAWEKFRPWERDGSPEDVPLAVVSNGLPP